jgi:hypothetical protein
MPIVQAFSPNTGAAIGGGDGPQQSASLYNVPHKRSILLMVLGLYLIQTVLLNL